MSVMIIDADKMALILSALTDREEGTVREAMIENYQAYKDRYNEPNTFDNFEFMWSVVLKKKKYSLTKQEFIDACDAAQSLHYNSERYEYANRIIKILFEKAIRRLSTAYDLGA